MFLDCANLTEINVDKDNPTFKSVDGVLYDKNGYYVMRIPEDGGEEGEDNRRHFSIPSKVVKLYPGAVHGVDADIVLHSNPQIASLPGHENEEIKPQFYLSLDDIDNTITEDETGFGGARNFTSANANTYKSANYKRKPITRYGDDGITPKYGTIVLPFVPENAMDKYEFFRPQSATAEIVTFTQVTEEEGLKVNTAYIYRLKENPKDITMEDGKDVFETAKEFTIQYHDKYDPTKETAGTFRALGAFVNHYIETENLDSYYYAYKSSDNKFHRAAKKLTYRPYRALFVWTPAEGQSAPAKLTLRLADGSTTEIAPSQIEGWEESVYYDLQGRRVLNPTNGVYIVNGKKVVIE